jgi:hypothetical protein
VALAHDLGEPRPHAPRIAAVAGLSLSGLVLALFVIRFVSEDGGALLATVSPAIGVLAAGGFAGELSRRRALALAGRPAPSPERGPEILLLGLIALAGAAAAAGTLVAIGRGVLPIIELEPGRAARIALVAGLSLFAGLEAARWVGRASARAR